MIKTIIIKVKNEEIIMAITMLKIITTTAIKKITITIMMIMRIIFCKYKEV